MVRRRPLRIGSRLRVDCDWDVVRWRRVRGDLKAPKHKTMINCDYQNVCIICYNFCYDWEVGAESEFYKFVKIAVSHLRIDIEDPNKKVNQYA